ncbi:hypothetical protein COB72_10815 [bacterium]|nr:MAG: hypothetical protein COB72_10815 [bacterium]
MFTKSLRISLIAMLMAVITPQALAQERINPVDDCINRIARVVYHTTHANRHIAGRTIEIIEELDAQGAENEAVVAAGQEGKVAINQRSQAAAQRIHSIVERCVASLQEHDAPRAAIVAVRQAGMVGAEAIGESARRNKVRINHAIAIAIE